MRTEFFDMKDVVVTDEYWMNAFEKEVAYLRSFDLNRLVVGFRENAGLPTKVKRYGGWENMLIAGHTLGHYLAAVSQAYANGACEKEDQEALYGIVTYLVDELQVCQEHSKGKKGFLFGATVMDPANVELQFDYVENNKTNIITEAWVPWYTMHKILDGLVRSYELTGYSKALEVAAALGDWTYERAMGWSNEVHRTVLSIEYGGMNDALYELYRCTKEEKHLKAAHMFDEETLFEAVLSGKEHVLNNRHANTTIPKFLGALNRFEVTGDEKYLTYVEKFFDTVIEKHTYITGGNSEWEHFGEDYVLDRERTNCNNETCNTYNMLKLSRKLFALTGNKKYADYYENTLLNAILSSQNPKTGMSMYFQPMASGYFKVFGTEFDKFWCCTGSGMENFTKLNDSIYYQFHHGMVVNVYVSSKVKDPKNGICLEQCVDFEKSDTVMVHFHSDSSISYELRFRIPDWSFGESIRIDGEIAEVEKESGYLVLTGEWEGDHQFELTFAKKIVAYSLPDCNRVFGFKYGPFVLSADLGTENEIKTTTGVDVTIPANKLDLDETLLIETNDDVETFIAHIEDHFAKEETSDVLCFVIKDVDQTLRFTPHFSKIEERYGIYWYFASKNELEDKGIHDRILEKKWRLEHLMDTVQPGYGQYENDAFHDMQDGGSVGSTNNGTSRMAKEGGFFSYWMRAKKDSTHVLEVHFTKEDDKKPVKILVGDTIVFERILDYNTIDGEDFVNENEYLIKIPVTKEIVQANLCKRMEEYALKVTVKGSGDKASARLMNFMYLMWE